MHGWEKSCATKLGKTGLPSLLFLIGSTILKTKKKLKYELQGKNVNI
jgi:hypothetical protein